MHLQLQCPLLGERAAKNDLWNLFVDRKDILVLCFLFPRQKENAA